MRRSCARSVLTLTLVGALAVGGAVTVHADTWGFGQRSCPNSNVYTAGYDKVSARKEHWGHMITTSKTFPYSWTYRNNAFQDVDRVWISGGQAYASIDVYSVYAGCL